MTKITRLCNLCGKELGEYDDFGVSYEFGYGSINDGDKMDLDLCCECLDKVTEHLINSCKLNPIKATK